MRKSGLLKIPAEKLKFFKEGRIKLETALLKDNNNGEYHFLRLTIQEHAPKIVRYHADIETDRQDIKKSFKNLLPVVQQAIINYSKNSQILRPQDFNL
jgi:GTPase SAR1 family protein